MALNFDGIMIIIFSSIFFYVLSVFLFQPLSNLQTDIKDRS